MKKVDLTQGKVMNVLLALAFPIIGGSLLQFTYSFIDMLWVGRLGSDAVASVGSASFFIGLGYAVNALVVIGTGIKVAHSVGRKDDEAVKAYINAGTLLNIIIGLLFAAVLIVMGNQFIRFLNIDTEEVVNQSYIYLVWSAPMLFFTFFNILYTRLLGSFGNNKIGFWISGVGLIINIILDPILIYGFKLGVAGAAIGSLIGNVVMFLLFLKVAWHQLKVDFKIGIKSECVKEIIRLGLPMASQRVLFTLVNIALARMIGNFGAAAIAAQKIGLQIESIALMVIAGFNGAIASFAGQNYGAKQFKRIAEGYHKTLALGIGYAVVMGIIFWSIPQVLVGLFVDDPHTIEIAITYIQTIAIGTVFSALEMISNGLFTGIGKPKIPATISIVFTVLRIPMALVLVPVFGVGGIWWSIALSTILKGSTAYIIYRLKVGNYNAISE